MAILQKGNKLGVCVHHSVYTPANNLAELKVQANLFNGWHKSKSWAEDTKTPSAYPYISYHYLMATNGEMLNVTDEKYVKYHAEDNFRKDLSFNLHGIAVCLTGNYENDKPTDAQMKALVEFIRDVEKRYDINARVRGHKETSATATACPGKNIGTSTSGWLKSVIANVNDPNYPPKPTPPPEPPPEAPKPCPDCEGYKKDILDLKEENKTLRRDLEASTFLVNDKNEEIKGLKADKEELKENLKKLGDNFTTLSIEKNRIENERNNFELENSKLKKQLEEGNKIFIEKILDWVVGELAKIFKKKD